MFWPINVLSSKRNGELHPSINVVCTLDNSQYCIGTTNSNTDTSGYVQMASQVQKVSMPVSVPVEYEVPIKSPPAKISKAPVPLPNKLGVSTIYEMPTVPDQTAYLTEDSRRHQHN